MIEAVKLDYDLDIFTSADYDVHSGSCISHQVHELQDVHERFGGFPDSYDLGNTMIRQLWWTREQIDFEQIGKQLGIEVVTISSILQPAGTHWKAGEGWIWDSKHLHLSANAGMRNKYTLQVSGFHIGW